MIDVLVVNYAGKACNFVTDLELRNRVSDCNYDATAVATEHCGKCVDCKSIALNFPVNWVCSNCEVIN